MGLPSAVADNEPVNAVGVANTHREGCNVNPTNQGLIPKPLAATSYRTFSVVVSTIKTKGVLAFFL